jgi:hypothetical protein
VCASRWHSQRDDLEAFGDSAVRLELPPPAEPQERDEVAHAGGRRHEGEVETTLTMGDLPEKAAQGNQDSGNPGHCGGSQVVAGEPQAYTRDR